MKIYNKSIPYTNKLLLQNVTGPSVLDVGGAEYLGRANALADAGHEVTVIDVHEPWGDLHPNVSFKQLAVENLTDDLQYDDIVLSNVLEHFDSPLEALNAVAGSLNHGGSIHILTPNRESLNRRIGLLMGKLSSLEEIPEKEVHYGHKHTFSVGSMKRLLTTAGLEIIHCKGIFLKPVPTGEMIQWPAERIDAFFQVAAQVPPELCHEVYFRAKRPNAYSG